MQIVQTKNDFMRIIYNPLVEKFYLGDFLNVQDNYHSIIAQIVEIESNEMDASLNILGAKFLFCIDEQGVMSQYNGYTPGRESRLRSVERNEVIRVVNADEPVTKLGRISLGETKMNVVSSFFDDHFAILSDKFEPAQILIKNLTKKLIKNKNVVIFDFTGSTYIEDSKRLFASTDFKMPLNFKTIDYIYEKGFQKASLESQALVEDIFYEVKKYADSTPKKFLPFSAFCDVVDTQYEQTPIAELVLLKTKLNKFQMNNIFAQGEDEFENINKTVNENKVTIIDFSKLDPSWHKEYCQFLVDEFKIPIYLFIRLSESNSDLNLIRSLYAHKTIRPVPVITYGYKFSTNIRSLLNNLIMFAPLFAQRDFPYYVSMLNRIEADEYIIYGSHTKNLGFIVKNDENLDDDDFETIEIDDIVEIDPVIIEPPEIEEYEAPVISEPEQQIEPEIEIIEEMAAPKRRGRPKKLTIIEAQEIPAPKKRGRPKVAPEKPVEIVEEPKKPKVKKEEKKTPIQVETKKTPPKSKVKLNLGEPLIEPMKVAKQEPASEVIEPEIIEQEISEAFDVNQEQNFQEVEIVEIEASIPEFDTSLNDEPTAVVEEEEPEEIIEPEPLDEEEIKEAQVVEEAAQVEAILDEEDLEFFETLNFEEEEPQIQEPVKNNGEIFIIEDSKDKVEDFINPSAQNQEMPQMLKKSNVPIYSSNIQKGETVVYKAGMRISHKKFGVGQIQKVVKYADKTLLSINFESIGKRLLDPTLALLKIL